MTALTEFFAREAARDRRVVVLEDALLGARFASYGRYRLRFFGFRYAVASVLQLVKVLLLASLFTVDDFLRVVVAAAAASLVTAAWWGALETLRSRVRDLYRFDTRLRVSREIARWVSASLLAAMVVAGAAAVGVIVIGMGGGIGPGELAIAAIVARTGFDLPVRTFHAGAYAVRRVYRPLWSIVGLDVLGFATLLALSPVIGAYAVAVGEALMAIAYAAMSVRFTARTNRVLGFAPDVQLRQGVRRGRGARGAPASTGPGGWAATVRQFGRRLPRRPRRRPRVPVQGAADTRAMRPWGRAAGVPVVAPAIAGAAMGLDSIVLVTGAAATAGQPERLWLPLLLAAISPTVRASFDWSRLMYFDLKRLEAAAFTELLGRFNRAVLWVAIGLGVLLAVVAMVVAIGLLSVPIGDAVWLLPFLLGASLLGIWQVEAFAAGAYGRVIAGGIALLAGFAAMPRALAAGWGELECLTVIAWAAAAAVRLTGWTQMGRSNDVLLPTAWLRRLAATDGPLHLGAVRVPDRDAASRAGPEVAGTRTGWRAMRLARRFGRRLGAHGGVTVFTPDIVAWFEASPARGRPSLPPNGRERGEGGRDHEARLGGGARLDGARVVLEAAGRVDDLRTAGGIPDGQAAIDALVEWGLMPTPPRPAESIPGGGASAADGIHGGVGDPAEGAAHRESQRTAAAVTARLMDVAPGAMVFAPSSSSSAALGALTPAERRIVLWDAIRYAWDLSVRPAIDGPDVTAWCPDGVLQLIFVVPASSPRGRRARWRRWIRAANLWSAAGGLTPNTMLGLDSRSSPTALAASAATASRRA